MTFEPGRKKSGGRQPGVLNKATMEIKEFARSILEDRDNQESLRQRILAGEAPNIELVLHHYRFGRPKTEIELNRKGITVIVNKPAPRSPHILVGPTPSLPMPENQ